MEALPMKTGQAANDQIAVADKALILSTGELFLKRALEIAGDLAKHNKFRTINRELIINVLKMLVNDEKCRQVGRLLHLSFDASQSLSSPEEKEALSEVAGDLQTMSYNNLPFIKDGNTTAMSTHLVNKYMPDEDEDENEGEDEADDTSGEEECDSVIITCACESLCKVYTETSLLTLDQLKELASTRSDHRVILSLIESLYKASLLK